MTAIEDEKEELMREMTKGEAMLMLVDLIKNLLGKADGFIKLWIRNLQKNKFWR